MNVIQEKTGEACHVLCAVVPAQLIGSEVKAGLLKSTKKMKPISTINDRTTGRQDVAVKYVFTLLIPDNLTPTQIQGWRQV